MNNKFSFLIITVFIFIIKLSNATDFIYAVNNQTTISKCPVSNGNIGTCTSSDFRHFKPNGIALTQSFAYLSSTNNTIYVCAIDEISGNIYNCRDGGLYVTNPTSIMYGGNGLLYITSLTEKMIRACSMDKNGQLVNCTVVARNFEDPNDLSISPHNNYTVITQKLFQQIQICPLLDNGYNLGKCSYFQDQNFYQPNASAIDPSGLYIYITNEVHSNQDLTICGTNPLSSDTCKGYNINNTSSPTDIISIEEENDDDETNTYNFISTKNTIISCQMDYKKSSLAPCQTFTDKSFTNISAIGIYNYYWE